MSLTTVFWGRLLLEEMLSVEFMVLGAQTVSKYEWSEPSSRKWVPVVRFIAAYIVFVIFSVGLAQEAFIALAPLATPEIAADELNAIRTDFEGMDPTFALIITLIPIFFVSLISRLIAGWRRMLSPKRNLLIMSTALIVFLVVFLPPDDWGNYRGNVWVPAPPSEETEYDIWTGLGAIIGFFLPYATALFAKRKEKNYV